MIKLNITLPSGAQVSIEADDKDLVREVLYSTMPHLNGVAEQPIEEVNGRSPDAAAHHNGTPTNGHGSAPPQMAPVANGADLTRAASNVASNGNHGPAPTATVASVVERPPLPAEPAPVATAAVAPATVVPAPDYRPSTPDEHEFIAFCQRVSPLGDMRRVVVAAEAADRHLNVQSVDPDELERLFTLAGWPIPHSFVQTLRNAARTKFRWLERIPGKSGHYRVTDTGRSIVLGENAPSRKNTSDNDSQN
ncbi:MAG: hypothetical protein F4X64_06705 [Chloroflexi bacterium]|nr:hypothetical protein [Chloroflexota bacterium]